ncbi:MAG: DJ-1/PfpI family protein [Pseudomonadales bacterium]
MDQQVVEDGNLVTSRNPGDLEPFCDKFMQALAS